MLVAWSGSTLAQCDVSKGEFLTEEEYCKLKKEAAMQYCSALEGELSARKAEADRLRGDVEAERNKANRLRREVRDLDSQLAEMKSMVAMMEREYGPYRNKEFEHRVIKGEYLSLIAEYDRVYGDAMKWPRLYRANRDQIEDPNLIYPDQMLKVPHGYPNWHLVVEGEFLSKIANYWEIYNDGREWPRIYEANRDQIKDPDLVYPDQVLTIPR